MGRKEARGSEGRKELSDARTLAITGPSGSGKTSFARRLTRALVGSGQSVTFIKSTHHPLNEDPSRGDTGRLLDAGACEAFLVNGSEAVRFDSARRIEKLGIDSVEEIVGSAQGENIVIEGFKGRNGWKSIDLGQKELRSNERGVGEALRLLGRDRDEKKRYQAIVFDLDGTLLDSWDALHVAVNEALALMGKPPIDRTRMIANVGEGVEALLVRCIEPGEEVTPAAMKRFVEVYDEECCKGSRLLPGVAETLGRLYDRGIRMGICTNKPTGFSEKILESLGVRSMMTLVVGPDMFDARKPDPRPVLEAIASTGADPDDVLFVGDMPIDVEAARAAGVDVAVLPTGSSSHAELLDGDPDYMLNSFEEILDHV